MAFSIITDDHFVLFADDMIFMDGKRYRYVDISAAEYSAEQKAFLFKCCDAWHRVDYQKEEDFEKLRTAFEEALRQHQAAIKKGRILDEYDLRAVRTLTEAGEHAAYFKQLLEQEGYSIYTPITPLYIEDVSASCKIIMNEEVFLMLCEIRDVSCERNAEVPFFLFGYEDVDGVIYFHTAEYHAEDLEQFETGFKPLAQGIDNAIIDYIDQEKDPRIKRPVRCYGHTHPPEGGGDRFSFADMSCIIEHELLNKYFSSGAIGSLDVLINPAGDVNFIKYERDVKPARFLKYRYVFVQAEDDGTIHRLAAYERGKYHPSPIKEQV